MFKQFFYTCHKMPVLLDVTIPIGASGAVGTITGAGVKSVTKLTTGIYQIKLQDNYYKLLGNFSSIVSPTTGSAIADGSFVTGTPYSITSVGTTTWGDLPSGITAAVGATFIATGAGGAGTGTATAVGNSGITRIDLIDNGTELAPSSLNNTGSYITFQTLAATSSSVTTLIPASPANGSVLKLALYLSNSALTSH